jgi:hypothetical protein
VLDAGKSLPTETVRQWIAAFGGADNVVAADTLAGRLRFQVLDRSAVNENAMHSLDMRTLTWVAADIAHVLVPGLGPGRRSLLIEKDTVSGRVGKS